MHWPDQVPGDGAEQTLRGQSWVLTGTLESMSRAEAKDKLQALGARVSGSVSASTSVVVAGPGAGAKLRKAESLEVEVWDEDRFTDFLKDRGLL